VKTFAVAVSLRMLRDLGLEARAAGPGRSQPSFIGTVSTSPFSVWSDRNLSLLECQTDARIATFGDTWAPELTPKRTLDLEAVDESADDKAAKPTGGGLGC
jgi:hypothetical protein